MQLDQYNSSVLPSGGVDGQASPASFGASTASALQGIGQAVGQLGEAAYRVEQTNAAIEAQDTVSRAIPQLKQQYEQARNSLDPTSPQYSQQRQAVLQQTQQAYRDAEQQMIEQASTQSSRKFISQHMARYGAVFSEQMNSDLSRDMVANSVHMLQGSENRSVDAVHADPSDGNVKFQMESYHSTIAANGYMTADQKLRLIDGYENRVGLAQNQALAAANPLQYLSSVGITGGAVSGGTAKGGVPTGSAKGSFDSALKFTLSHEGGLGIDNNGAAVNYGINQKANPDVDVKSLTKEGAAAIYKANYWNAIGGDALAGKDPALATAVFDTAVLAGPAKAKELLAASDGSAAGFTDQRQKFLQSLSEQNPAKYGGKVAQAWDRRTRELSAMAHSASTPGGDVPQVQPMTDGDILSATAPNAGWDKLTDSQKIQMARYAEGLVGKQMADARGAMATKLTDISAALADGKTPLAADGKPLNLDGQEFSKDGLQTLYGQEQGSKLYENLSATRQLGYFVASAATMPVAQRMAYLAQNAPAAGPGYADQSKIYDHMLAANQQVQKQIAQGSADYGVAHGIGGAAPIDFSKPDFAAGLNSRRAMASAMANEMGGAYEPLTKSESQQLGSILQNAQPKDALSVLNNLRSGLKDDDLFKVAMRQVAPNAPMAAWAGVAYGRKGSVSTSAGAVDSQTVASRVLQGSMLLQPKTLEGEGAQKTGRPFEIKDKDFSGYFSNAVGNAYAGLNAAGAAQQMTSDYNAAKAYVAATLVASGRNGDTMTRRDVEDAVHAVAGNTAQVGRNSHVFAPWGMDEKSFKNKFSAIAESALTSAGYKGAQADPDNYDFLNVGDGSYKVINAHGAFAKPLVSLNGSAPSAIIIKVK